MGDSSSTKSPRWRRHHRVNGKNWSLRLESSWRCQWSGNVWECEVRKNGIEHCVWTQAYSKKSERRRGQCEEGTWDDDLELGGGDEVLLLVFLVGLLSSGSGIRRAPDSIELTNKSVQVRCSSLGQWVSLLWFSWLLC